MENQDTTEEQHVGHTIENSQGQEGWLFAPCAPFDPP